MMSVYVVAGIKVGVENALSKFPFPIKFMHDLIKWVIKFRNILYSTLPVESEVKAESLYSSWKFGFLVVFWRLKNNEKTPILKTL